MIGLIFLIWLLALVITKPECGKFWPIAALAVGYLLLDSLGYYFPESALPGLGRTVAVVVLCFVALRLLRSPDRRYLPGISLPALALLVAEALFVGMSILHKTVFADALESAALALTIFDALRGLAFAVFELACILTIRKQNT